MTSTTILPPVSPDKNKAVILLSGGLDSYTSAALAREAGYCCYALTINYNQRHQIEVEKAVRIAQALDMAEHKFIQLDLRQFGGSALTSSIAVPKRETQTLSDDIPATYVPARNTIFLALALGWAEVIGAFDIIIGANAVDYSGYPDCRDEFLRAFETLANLGTKAGMEKTGRFCIHAPLIQLSKAQIIQEGVRLKLDYNLTHSCYDPDPKGRACGQCDSCRLRLKGFARLGLKDPIEYVSFH